MALGDYLGVISTGLVNGNDVYSDGTHLWVTDSNEVVNKLTLAGASVATYSLTAAHPVLTGITSDGNHFFVADNSNERIAKYTLDFVAVDLDFIDYEGDTGVTSPNSLTYDPVNDYIICIDAGNDNVYAFNASDGSFVSSLFSAAFLGSRPRGIEYVNGFLWVLDQTGDDITELTLAGAATGREFSVLTESGNQEGLGYAGGIFYTSQNNVRKYEGPPAAAGATYTLDATTATALTIDNKSATIVRSLLLDAGAQALTIDAQAINAAVTRAIVAESTGLTITAQSAGIDRGLIFTAGSSSLEIDGKSVTFSNVRVLSATSATLSLTRTAAGLIKSSILDAGTNSLDIDAQAASIGRSFTLTAGTASYTIDELSAALVANRELLAGAEALTLAGVSATLTVDDGTCRPVYSPMTSPYGKFCP